MLKGQEEEVNTQRMATIKDGKSENVKGFCSKQHNIATTWDESEFIASLHMTTTQTHQRETTVVQQSGCKD